MTALDAPTTLAGLTEEERYERYDVLQQRLDELWRIMRLNLDDESEVVVPSVG